MTDQEQNPETVAEQPDAAAGVAQDAPVAEQAPEAPAEQAAASAPPETPPDTPEEAAAEFGEDVLGEDPAYVPNPAAHRGIQAGPAEHPRTRALRD